MKLRLFLAGALVCTLAGPPAEARQWVVTVGARASTSPPYMGADRNVIRGAPTLSIAPLSEHHRYSPPGDGTTFALIDSRRFELGPMVRFQRKREPEDALIGLDKVDRAVEPGAFVAYWPADWLRVRLEARRGVTGNKGWAGDGGIDLVYSGGRWDAAIGPRVGFGDDKYLRTYFGVTPQEAAASPFISAAYAPEGGRRYTGLQAGLAYRLDDHWQAGVDFGYQRLSSRAARSPILQLDGSRNQYSGGLSISYRFTVGKARKGRAR